MIFEKIELKWEGKSYVIPSDRVLMALAEIEAILTLHELQGFRERGTFPMVRVSQAYGAVLRFAGCNATDDEVYAGMFQEGDFNISIAVIGLLSMMVPSSAAVKVGGPPLGNVSSGAAKSSRKRSRSRVS